MRIIFAGTPDIAATILSVLLTDTAHQVVAVYTQPDRPAGRGRKLQASPVKQLAQQHQLDVLQPERLCCAEVQSQLRQFDADLMIVVAYGLILPAEVLAIPKLGCWNVHVSLLPRWRGAAPIQRAIEAGDAETGVTIMQMDSGLDTGDILLQQTLAIGLQETAGQLHDRLARLGADALLQTLIMALQGNLNPIQQDQALATYAAKLSKTEAQIDWSKTAAEIDRKIRAFSPWPICTTYLDGVTLRIHQATVLSQDGIPAKPGTIIAVSKTGIDVATGQGTIRILKAQFPGAKPLQVNDLVNSKAASFISRTFLSLIC